MLSSPGEVLSSAGEVLSSAVVAAAAAPGATASRLHSGQMRCFRRRTRRTSVGPLDYKDVGTLQKYVSQQGKLHSRKRTGFTAQKQRELKLAVKYARYLGLLPYTT